MPRLLERSCGVVLAASLLGLWGCEPKAKWDPFGWFKKKSPQDAQRAEENLSVGELARRLDLSVSESSDRAATLANRENTVMIVGDPGGQVFVNGQEIDPAGPIRAVGGILQVPASLVPKLRAQLRPAGVGAAEEKDPEKSKTPEPDKRTGPVVVVDAGHGGNNGGATRKFGTGSVRVEIQEKDLNLDAALEVARLLRKSGVRVLMTRADDSTVSLDKRVALANQPDVKLLVSIHSDAERKQTGNARGFTVFVGKKATAASRAAARKIERRLAQTGTHSRGVRPHEDAIRVLVAPKCPSVLVEMGFMSNPRDLARLMEGKHRRKLAKAIAEGIQDFLKSR